MVDRWMAASVPHPEARIKSETRTHDPGILLAFPAHRPAACGGDSAARPPRVATHREHGLGDFRLFPAVLDEQRLRRHPRGPFHRSGICEHLPVSSGSHWTALSLLSSRLL